MVHYDDSDKLDGTEYYGPDITDGQTGEFEIDLEPEWWEGPDQFNSTYTPPFGELLQTGWDWGRNTWTSSLIKPEVMTIIRPRLNKKIERRYYMRELSVEIPGRWKMLFLNKLEELLDQAAPVYNEISKGLDLTGITETKSRLVNSEFPQAMLKKDSEDYSSNATEAGSEVISSATTLEAFQLYESFFQHPDEKIVEGLDSLFSHYPYFLSSDLGRNFRN